jgi:polyisoprenoid-binding protein YceI
MTWRCIVGVALLAAAALATLGRAADAPAWTLDAKASRVTFTGKQMGVPSEGRFKTFSADIRFDQAAPETSRVAVTIDTASADAGNPDIDKELKRPKWLEVERFPEARFVTSAIRVKDGKAYEAAAKLTIRDVTQDVVLPFTIEIGPDPKDPGLLLARARGEVTISRLAFGIGRDEWADTKIVGDAVTIRIDVVARRQKP